MSLRLEAVRGVTILLLIAAGFHPVRAEQTRVAIMTAADAARGEAEGVAVTSRGRIFLAPRVSSFGKPGAPDAPAQVFAAAADDAGNVLLATGPDGELQRMTTAGERSVLFRADEPLITAVVVRSSGEVLAASAPGGKIYLVRPDGKASIWCDTKERYVWALAVNPDGSVFAATGDDGRLLKIDRNGNPKVFFDSDEAHLVSLARADDGGLWVGGSSRGSVYHVDADGNARVVYDDELPEAKAIVPMESGAIVVAFDAPPVTEKRPPALRLRMAGGSASPRDNVADLDARPTTAIQGVIEGLTSTESDETTPLRGKLVRIAADGAAVEIWRSRTEAPFALAVDDRHRALFATGEPAKLWRAEDGDEVSVLATLREGQATAFAATRRALIVATSNPGATYRLDVEASGTGTFLAPPSDAGAIARWGTLIWQGTGSTGRVELSTRSGNCEDPDGTWSAWSPVSGTSKGGAVSNPPARFLQWRAQLYGAPDAGPSISSVVASYATRNRAPSIKDLRIEPASGAVNAKATLRWSTSDPDGDGVTVDVQARVVGSGEWKSAVRTDPAPGKSYDPSLGNDGSSKDGKGIWDTSTWDEGPYEVRAVASDQSANPPGEGLAGDSALPVLVVVDRTPPSIEARRKGDAIEVTVDDALSGVMRLEVVGDGRVAFSPRCADGVCDGRHETFKFPAASIGGSGTWSLRATDAAGNPIETPVPSR